MKKIDELVAEMREVSGDETVKEIVIAKSDWLTLADRIEKACKTLEKAYNNAVSADARHCLENVKLRRALEPVMNVNADKILNSNIDATTLLASIVKEAQAIMKGGVE